MQEEKLNLREAINNCEITGKLVEKNLEEKTEKGTDGKNKTIIMGDLVIQTAENNSITVNFYSTKNTKAGKINPSYTSLKKALDNYVAASSINTEDEENELNASIVSVTGAKIDANEQITSTGDIATYPTIRGSFVRRVKPENFDKGVSQFELELYITKIVEEMSKEEETEPTGRKIIEGLIPQYGGRIIPATFIVESKKMIAAIEKYYSVGDTVKVAGTVISIVEDIEEKIGGEYGEDEIRIVKRVTKEYKIRSGGAPYENNSFSKNKIELALEEREKNLKKKNEENKNKKNTASPKSTTKSKKGKNNICPF